MGYMNTPAKDVENARLSGIRTNITPDRCPINRIRSPNHSVDELKEAQQPSPKPKQRAANVPSYISGQILSVQILEVGNTDPHFTCHVKGMNEPSIPRKEKVMIAGCSADQDTGIVFES